MGREAYGVDRGADGEKRASPPGLASRLARGLWAMAITIVSAPRMPVTALLFLWGVLLCAASAFLGVSSTHWPVSFAELRLAMPGTEVSVNLPGTASSQVGFLAAPNWSITAVAIWPAMYYVLRTLIDSADRVFADIDRSPMTWTRGKTRRGVSTTWRRNRNILARLAVLFVVCGLLFSIFSEWWSYSRAPLLFGTLPRELEYDWSSIDVNGPASNLLHAAFTLAAFAYQGIAIAIMATFAAAALLMARTMGVHGSGEARPALLIDIMSNDPSKRVGFERFVIVIDYMIVFVALAFANFFFTRIQNAYLRQTGEGRHQSLLEFIQQDFIIYDIAALPTLFQTEISDFSSWAVSIGAVVLLFLCFFFFNATLRHTALQARNRSDRELLEDDMVERSGLEANGVRERLREANVWPLGYSDFMPTLSFLTICLVTIVAYRIGLYLVFLWIAGWILARAAQGLIKR